MSGLITSTAPGTEPVSLAEAKLWLRVDGEEEDALIGALITAARQHVEHFTRRALITTGFTLSLDSFPIAGRHPFSQSRTLSREIILPRPPLATVASVSYLDEDGATQTLPSGQYVVDVKSTPGRIVLREDYDWPDTELVPNAVTIVYTAGYGAATDIPQGLRVALRYLVSHWFENRTPINVGNIVNEIPLTAQTLMWQERIPELF